MALQTLSTIKDWFKTGLKPSQTQFWDTWDSFRHKNDKVPVKEVEGLDQILDQLPPKTVYESGQLLVFKNPGNESGNNFLEPDDTVIGFVEGDFLNAGTYYGGDPLLFASYQRLERIGSITSFANGFTSYTLRQEVVDRIIEEGHPIALMGISGPETINYDYALFSTEGDFIRLRPGEIIVLKDPTGEFNDSEPFTIVEQPIYSIEAIEDSRGSKILYYNQNNQMYGDYFQIQRSSDPDFSILEDQNGSIINPINQSVYFGNPPAGYTGLVKEPSNIQPYQLMIVGIEYNQYLRFTDPEGIVVSNVFELPT
ncbi:hypothetical protein [Flavobacterium tiangeerense]|uniref:hypothetical protein n=1 Tax=Flavobacterium tiangeerense TaxID=459471 RepID=UPI0011A1DD96|nr:hypothetical protein [Flavobacterium tiangeerense]